MDLGWKCKNSHLTELSFPLPFSPPKLHFKVPLSPVIAAKKARPSDGGSDEVRDQHLIGDLDVLFLSKLIGHLRSWKAGLV